MLKKNCGCGIMCVRVCVSVFVQSRDSVFLSLSLVSVSGSDMSLSAGPTRSARCQSGCVEVVSPCHRRQSAQSGQSLSEPVDTRHTLSSPHKRVSRSVNPSLARQEYLTVIESQRKVTHSQLAVRDQSLSLAASAACRNMSTDSRHISDGWPVSSLTSAGQCRR